MEFMKNSYLFTTVIIAILIFTLGTLSLLSIDQADAYHEQQLRNMGIGYNDYDNDGVTCATTDLDADAWSDQFYNHHNPDINQLIACEKKKLVMQVFHLRQII